VVHIDSGDAIAEEILALVFNLGFDRVVTFEAVVAGSVCAKDKSVEKWPLCLPRILLLHDRITLLIVICEASDVIQYIVFFKLAFLAVFAGLFQDTDGRAALLGKKEAE